SQSVEIGLGSILNVYRDWAKELYPKIPFPTVAWRIAHLTGRTKLLDMVDRVAEGELDGM
ncbi:hypothetical protein KIPB_016602, partial [Kipferlia bialata]